MKSHCPPPSHPARLGAKPASAGTPTAPGVAGSSHSVSPQLFHSQPFCSALPSSLLPEHKANSPPQELHWESSPTKPALARSQHLTQSLGRLLAPSCATSFTSSPVGAFPHQLCLFPSLARLPEQLHAHFCSNLCKKPHTMGWPPAPSTQIDANHNSKGVKDIHPKFFKICLNHLKRLQFLFFLKLFCKRKDCCKVTGAAQVEGIAAESQGLHFFHLGQCHP